MGPWSCPAAAAVVHSIRSATMLCQRIHGQRHPLSRKSFLRATQTVQDLAVMHAVHGLVQHASGDSPGADILEANML